MRAILAVVLLSTGCFDPRADVRIFSPTFAIDVDAGRTSLEDALCARATDVACEVLGALDAYDDGRMSSPPRLPEVLPRELSHAKRLVAVAPWLDEQRARHDFMPPLRAPLAFDAEELGFEPASLDAELLAASLRIEANTLTFDLPQMRLGVERDGEVIDVGVIEGARDRVIEGGEEGVELALAHLVQGGARTLLEALSAGEAAIVVAPEGLELTASGSTWLRPGGSASLSFVIDLAVSVTPLLEEAAR